jgi:hypothetical protein
MAIAGFAGEFRDRVIGFSKTLMTDVECLGQRIAPLRADERPNLDH